MANTLEYSKIFQPLLDQQVTQESTTGWMEANDKFIKYEGGDEVKIATMLTDGLANYDRSNGFTTGSVDLKWNPYKLTQDRGRSFTLDSMDVDQTNFVATASTVMSEFQKQQVIPEIDAYRYSKIASLAIEGSKSREVALTAENIVSELLKDLTFLLSFSINISKNLSLTIIAGLVIFATSSTIAKNLSRISVPNSVLVFSRPLNLTETFTLALSKINSLAFLALVFKS